MSPRFGQTARQIGLLGLNDLRLTLRDRPSFVWMLLLPLALMWMFGAMNRGGPPPKVGLGIEDRDGGWLAQALVHELAGEKIELTVLRTGSRPGSQETPARILVIPQGFTANVLAGHQQTLRLEKSSGASEEFSLAAEVDIVRAIVRIVGRLAETGPPEAADPQGIEHQRAFEALAKRPPLVTVAASTAGGGGHPVPQGFAQSVPGTLTMTVLMMNLIYGAFFLTLEKRQGMLRRQGTLPLSRSTLFLGKLAGRLLLAILQAILLLLAGRYLFGVSLGTSPTGLAVLVGAYLLAVAALSTLLGAILATPEQASAVGWVSSMILAALGGCWWPSEIMPRWLWKAAHVLPTPWAMDGFHALLSFGHGLEAVLLPAGVLLGFAAVFAVLGARLLRLE